MDEGRFANARRSEVEGVLALRVHPLQQRDLLIATDKRERDVHGFVGTEPASLQFTTRSSFPGSSTTVAGVGRRVARLGLQKGRVEIEGSNCNVASGLVLSRRCDGSELRRACLPGAMAFGIAFPVPGRSELRRFGWAVVVRWPAIELRQLGAVPWFPVEKDVPAFESGRTDPFAGMEATGAVACDGIVSGLNDRGELASALTTDPESKLSGRGGDEPLAFGFGASDESTDHERGWMCAVRAPFGGIGSKSQVRQPDAALASHPTFRPRTFSAGP